MRKITLVTLFSCLSILLFVHCRKGFTYAPQKLTYQLNGQTFSDPNKGNAILDQDHKFIGIEIRNDSVFGGRVFFYHTPANCAFTLLGTLASFSADCKLTFINPADSLQGYLYRSGAINYSYSNCRHKKAYDPQSGYRGEYDECAVNGTFSLTLANKNNETIVITNGSFTFESVRK